MTQMPETTTVYIYVCLSVCVISGNLRSHPFVSPGNEAELIK